jgi:hypothetical protein
LVDALALGTPLHDRRCEIEALGILDRTIEGHPDHDLGIREMLRRTAHFPDAAVRLFPHRAQMLEELALDIPAGLGLGNASPARLMQRVHDFTEHIQLQLPVCTVADAHGRRAFVAGEPRHFPFGEAALTADAIHDLQLFRAAGHGTQQPMPPGFSLLEVAGIHESEQGQRGIAQPAEAIVPVALSANVLGQ